MNKEIQEKLNKVNECLQKIKDIDQKRCNEASERRELYDPSITSWATTAQSLLPNLLDVPQCPHDYLQGTSGFVCRKCGQIKTC